jgi:hypothetical protein|tara:strand:+ start:708 stop:980 length:273 start_codon:yes stop_codon:yes gene_type:complete
VSGFLTELQQQVDKGEIMLNNVKVWLRGVIDLALVVVALGVVLQILFPQALVFINADVTANLIGLIKQFSGAGLVGVIAAGIVYYLIKKT